jgi:hypothetical protein
VRSVGIGRIETGDERRATSNEQSRGRAVERPSCRATSAPSGEAEANESSKSACQSTIPVPSNELGPPIHAHVPVPSYSSQPHRISISHPLAHPIRPPSPPRLSAGIKPHQQEIHTTIHTHYCFPSILPLHIHPHPSPSLPIRADEAFIVMTFLAPRPSEGSIHETRETRPRQTDCSMHRVVG